MQQSYNFSRHDEIEPTGNDLQSNVTTSVRGSDPPLDAVFSGVQSFIIACGFDLKGSGVGPVDPPAA